MQKAGTDANAVDNEGNTALHLAATGASADIINALVENGCELKIANAAGVSALHVAAKHRTVATVTSLVTAGAHVRARASHTAMSATTACCFHARTPCWRWQPQGAAVQLEAEDNNKRTPLHYACYFSSSEVVSEICRLSANVNHVDKKGRTPLHVVVCREHSGPPPPLPSLFFAARHLALPWHCLLLCR